jgi:hypothetical protein
VLPTTGAGSGSFAADTEPPNVTISETVDEMIVDHPDGLHVAVDRGGSDEAESSPLQIATERIGLARRRGNLAHGFPSILSRAAVNELPAIRVEAAVFFPHGQKRSGILHRSGDLRAVPNNPGIGGELVDPSRGVSGDPLRIEVAERATVAAALIEDDRPIESRLRGFQNNSKCVRSSCAGTPHSRS